MCQTIPALAVALGLAVTAAAQDTSVKSKTEIETNDARALTMTGCLAEGPKGTFLLRDATIVESDDVTVRSKAETDVDDDGAEVEIRARSEVDADDDVKAVGTSGLRVAYELSPQRGVDLASLIGRQVRVLAVAVDRKDGGDDDADIEITDRTKVERDDAPDAGAKTRTDVHVPRGEDNRVSVLKVTALGTSCAR